MLGSSSGILSGGGVGTDEMGSASGGASIRTLGGSSGPGASAISVICPGLSQPATTKYTVATMARKRPTAMPILTSVRINLLLTITIRPTNYTACYIWYSIDNSG